MFKLGRYYFLFILAMGMLMSCEEEFILQNDNFDAKVVVNALFTEGQPWNVEVSTSRNILDDQPQVPFVDNAKVEIFNPNGDFLYELFHQANGSYGRDGYSPVVGRRYGIKVSVPGMKPVTAWGVVPHPTELTIRSVEKLASEESGIEVDFQITRTAEENHYYIWEVIEISEDGIPVNGGEFSLLSSKWINNLTNDPSKIFTDRVPIIKGTYFGDEGIYQSTYNSLEGYSEDALNNLGNDNAFENDEQQNGASPDDEVDPSNGSSETYQYELRVMTISEDLYHYYNSVQQFIRNNGSTPNSNIQPDHIFTNIENGLGIFAGYNESYIQF